MQSPSRIAAVDLFCGAGGKTHGFVRAGIPVVAGVDIDETCEYAYTANNPASRFHARSVDALEAAEVASWFPSGAIRVLIGCAPCQPFSTYSNRYRRTQVDPPREDGRWRLLNAFSRLIGELRPEIVSAENVPELALQRHDVYGEFVEGLAALGYAVTEKVVRCADYGVPQTRERLVVLASLIGPIDLIAPTHAPHEYVTVRSQIGHLPALSAGGPAPENDPLHRSSRLSPLNTQRVRATPEGGGWQDWPDSLRLACHRKESGMTYPSVYGRMRWDALAPTITTQCFGLGNGRFGHPEQDRAISLREAALLQTFPEGYAFVPPGGRVVYKHLGRHIGNAVPVALGEAIARSITQHVNTLAYQAAGIPGP